MKPVAFTKLFVGLLVSGVLLWAANQPQAAEAPLHVVVVGGGPDLEDNGAEIESHVRFATEILPRNANRYVHFTDGKARGKTVSFTNSAKLSAGRRALNVLLPNNDFGPESESRAPNLGAKITGPAKPDAIRRSFGKVAGDLASSPAPLLLYFAGHGSRNSRNEDNNYFDLWDSSEFYVTHLASEIARIPEKTPIVLVMVQCFSGSFANVLFRHGEAGNSLDGHNIVGFFAASKDRTAAGCGSEIHEPEYQDFSSYFFGALCGRSRLGQPMTGADYDADGAVTMHEAFCFALIHDLSGDTPNCTSEAFLRRYAPLPDPELYAAPFEKIVAHATPAERAALDALSERLELTGEDRLRVAHDRLIFRDPIARASIQDRTYEAGKRLNELRQKSLAPLFERWPALRWSESADYEDAAEKAERELTSNPKLCAEILDTSRALAHANEELENEEAFLLRFTGLCASLVRGAHLHATAQEPIKARFDKLCAAERSTLPLEDR